MITTETEKKIRIGAEPQNFITGMVNPDGDVAGSDETITHETLLFHIPKQLGIHRNDMKWRLHKDDEIVRWWDEIGELTDLQKFAVEDFLKHQYNVKVKRHGKNWFQKLKQKNG